MDQAKTSDGVDIPMNMQHAIMVKQSETHSQIKDLYNSAIES